MTPLFSVIVPTRNRPAALEQCLRELARQDIGRDAFDVIVVDDGGAASIAHLVETLKTQVSVSMITQQHAGPAAARNAGARFATGRYLAFIDDDCVPAIDWLRQLTRVLDQPGAGLCGGRVTNGLPNNLCSAAGQTLLDVVYEWQPGARLRFFSTNNLAIAATDFRAIGGFDAAFRVSEDREFCDRWAASGGALTFVPDAIVIHRHDLSPIRFVRRHFAYGRGTPRFYAARVRDGRPPLRVDPRFYRLLVTAPWRRGARRPMRLLAAILTALAANTTGYAWEKLTT